MYPPELVKPMREDLTKVGFSELHTANDVEEALKKEGTTLVVVNSWMPPGPIWFHFRQARLPWPCSKMVNWFICSSGTILKAALHK